MASHQYAENVCGHNNNTVWKTCHIFQSNKHSFSKDFRTSTFKDTDMLYAVSGNITHNQL